MGFVEEQAEIGEDHPEFLPAAAVLELSQQVSRKLVLKEMFADVCPRTTGQSATPRLPCALRGGDVAPPRPCLGV